MDPFSPSNDSNLAGSAGGLDELSLDKEDYLNDSFSMHTTSGYGGEIEERNGVNLFSLDGTVEVVPSLFQFKNLNLQASTSIEGGLQKDCSEVDDIEDPFAALEAAIEEDKPK